MDVEFDVVMASPLPGRVRIGLRFSETGLAEAEWLPPDTPLRRPHNAQEKAAVEQLQSFLGGDKVSFDLPLDLRGTPYQQRVWRALMAISPGKVKSYGELARELHSSARAVANACRANPVPIIVPCHRVVGARDLGGYMGAVSGEPLVIKEWLLRHEGAL